MEGKDISSVHCVLLDWSDPGQTPSLDKTILSHGTERALSGHEKRAFTHSQIDPIPQF